MDSVCSGRATAMGSWSSMLGLSEGPHKVCHSNEQLSPGLMKAEPGGTPPQLAQSTQVPVEHMNKAFYERLTSQNCPGEGTSPGPEKGWTPGEPTEMPMDACSPWSAPKVGEWLLKCLSALEPFLRLKTQPRTKPMARYYQRGSD